MNRICKLLCVSLCFLFFFAGCSFDDLPNDVISVSGSIINNDYNNYLAGANLARIDKKLYYNYYKSPTCYGLIEISREEPKRIHWNGEKWFGSDHYNYPIRAYDDKLVVKKNDCELICYSSVTKEFGEFDEFPCSYIGTINVEEASYCISSDESNLIKYRNDQKIILTNDYVTNLYLSNEYIYYAAYVQMYEKSEVHICRYSTLDDDIEVLCVTQVLPETLYVYDNYIVFIGYTNDTMDAQKGLFKIDMNLSSYEIKTIVVDDSILSLNLFDGVAYIASKSGIKIYDINSDDFNLLCDEYAEECYILDDKWVYFVGKNCVLWRVTQDGAVVEKVYG